MVIVLLVIAAFKGHRVGLIVGAFSYVAFIIGIAAAMKLSAIAAIPLSTMKIVPDKWLPFIAFLLVFTAVVIIVKLLAKLLQSATQKIMLGWLNRLGGVALFALLYISVFAIFLFYLTRMNVISDTTTSGSATYPFIKILGRAAVEALGDLIPLFKGLFTQLESFFDVIAQKAGK